jgi:hypothetical protein
MSLFSKFLVGTDRPQDNTKKKPKSKHFEKSQLRTIIESTEMDVDDLRVAKVAKQLHEAIKERLSSIAESREVEESLKLLLADLHQFQACPHLLDPMLSTYLRQIIKCYGSDIQIGAITEVFYNIGKIVSAKKLLNFFPTDIGLLQELTHKFSEKLHWHEQYLLLCWLTVLVLAPFQFDKFGPELKHKLYSIGRSQLNRSGPLQPLGARLVASIVMRSDCDQVWDEFVEELTGYFEGAGPVLAEGYLLSLNISLQKDSRNKVDRKFGKLNKFMLKLMQRDSNADLTSKILSKFMINVMNQEDDDWDTIEGIINWFQDNFKNNNTDTRLTLANQYRKLITRVDDCMGIDLMLDLLTSTVKLVKDESFETMDTNLLHTQLLSIAELLRVDLIDHNGFNEIVTTLDRTFFFQQARITFISGSNIRDASNYIAWALAKYQKKQIQPEITIKIFINLLFVCCFDKDIMIRRSATGALQELVGRHGVKTWQHFYPYDSSNAAKSINTIEILDYVDLGSIEKSYCEIPSKLLDVFPDLRPKFLEFLVGNVFNLDSDIVRLSARALRILIEGEDEQSREGIVTEIISKAGTKTSNAFIALSQLIPLLTSTDSLKGVMSNFYATKINHHKDPPFVRLSYLSLLNVLLDTGVQLTDQIFDNLFEAIRHDSKEMTQILKQIASKLEFPDSYWKRWYLYMKHNNLNTSASVSYLKCFESKMNEVLMLLASEATDHNVKAAVIGSISEYIATGKSLDQTKLIEVVNQLDDYSMSEQGDVGSKVRLATLRLLDVNFSIIAQALRPALDLKLWRLSVEPIDRLRHEAVILLQRLYGANEVDITTRSHSEYFKTLLEFFQAHCIESKNARIELLRGYVFTAGALKATDTLVSGSLVSFCDFYMTLDSHTQKEILLDIASLIKPEPTLAGRTDFKSQRSLKQILVGMQFYSRVLLANIPVPETFNMNGLYVRIYNLHLSTKNITRLSCAIKIFGYMYVAHDMQKAKERLVVLMTTHQLTRVRAMAREELYMLYLEKFIQTGDVKYKEELSTIESVD